MGAKVFVRFWYGARRWRAGVVLRRSGNATYDVQVGDQLHRRHATQLLRDVSHAGVTPYDEAAHDSETLIDEISDPVSIDSAKAPLVLTPDAATPAMDKAPVQVETPILPHDSATTEPTSEQTKKTGGSGASGTR